MKYEKILVPIDGSDGSRQALAAGTDLAERFGAEITLVFVNEELAVPAYNAGYPLSGEHDGLMRQEVIQADANIERHEQFLSEAIRDMQMDYPNVKTQLLDGDPANSICEYAERMGMDLIVIGNRGLSGLKKLMLGSVSQKVVSHAHCPVLVVK